jgi:hypothetical protein
MGPRTPRASVRGAGWCNAGFVVLSLGVVGSTCGKALARPPRGMCLKGGATMAAEKVDELLGAILRWTMTAGESNAQGKKEICLDALRRIQGFAADAIEELKRS